MNPLGYQRLTDDDREPDPETGVPKFRQRIVDREKALYREARKRVGPGFKEYGVHVLVDDCGLLPTVRVYCGRNPGTGWQPPLPDYDVRDPKNAVPPGPWKSPLWAFGFVVAKDFGDLKAGQVCRVCRYSSGTNVLVVSSPKTQERLDQMRADRAARKVAKEMDRSPLFADQIREDEYGSSPPPDEQPVKLTRRRKAKGNP